MSHPILRNGDVILDRAGMPIAQVTRDLIRGDVLQPGDFIFADGHEPVRGELLPSCISDFLVGVS